MSRPCPALIPQGLCYFLLLLFALAETSLPCPLGAEAQGPGGKEEVANWRVLRRNKAGVEDGKQGDPGLATSLLLASVASSVEQD